MSQPVRVLALDISGSRAFVAAIDADGGLLLRSEVPNSARDAMSYWPRIMAAAAAVVEAVDPAPVAVGIAFGGPVGRDGRILSLHVGGWSEIDPAAELAERLGIPCWVENDANCGALGEQRFGAWGSPGCLVFLTCSTGIGGGVVSEGRLLRGVRGLAGEIGHIPVAPDGLSCACGSRGCLEAMCSGTAIGRRATAALAASRESRSLLADALVGGAIEGAKPVFEAAATGDDLACELLGAVFADFGRGIAAVQNVFDPELIVIGGGVAIAGAALTRPVAAAALDWVMRDRRGHLRLEAASLGLNAQLYGAAAVALDGLAETA